MKETKTFLFWAAPILLLILILIYQMMQSFGVSASLATTARSVANEPPSISLAVSIWNAHANAISAIFSSLGVIVGLVSAFLIWNTFKVTRKQVEILQREREPWLSIRFNYSDDIELTKVVLKMTTVF